MQIILSAAVSADGYLDTFGGERLILSSPEDWRAVHSLRAGCDAILVGAETVRRDNPSLVIRERAMRKKRITEGRSPDIIKVTVSGSGKLDPMSRFFTEGDAEKIVFTHGTVSHELSEAATVISRPEITAAIITCQLRKMGIKTLLVEGGSNVLSMFLRERNWDQFRLAIAPVFVGDARAPRLVLDGDYPPMTLVRNERLGQTAVLHFVNRTQYRADCNYIMRAVDISRQCPPDKGRYRVGAVVVTPCGLSFDGFTGETAPENHAEEEAIIKATAAGIDLTGATIYSSIEPCTIRKSKPSSCTENIIGLGFSRVVFALREPDKFVRCEGVRQLTDAGIEVSEIAAFAPDVIRINSHIL
jgi:5-amino-6-(5-phosphoribosylamino)uracil reductase